MKHQLRRLSRKLVGSNSAITAYLTSSKAPHSGMPHSHTLSFLRSSWSGLVFSAKLGEKFTQLIHHAEKSVDVSDILGYLHLLGHLDFGWIWVDLSTIWPKSFDLFLRDIIHVWIFTSLCWVWGQLLPNAAELSQQSLCSSWSCP